MSSQMTELENLVIERACEKLVNKFALCSDSNDFNGLAALFTEDGVYTRPTVPNVEIVGREAIYNGFLARPPLVIRHLVTNCVIDVKSSTEALGHSYIVFMASNKVEDELPLTAGSMHIGDFRDEFVLDGGSWRIKSRYGSLALKT